MVPAGVASRPSDRNDESTAQRLSDADRFQWPADSISKKSQLDLAERWYQSNTREPIRDETLRSGSVTLGAVLQRSNVPPQPRRDVMQSQRISSI
jgi:hypothetical protein